MELEPTYGEHKQFLTDNVLSGKMKMYNNISGKYIDVTSDNVDKIAKMLVHLAKHHGVNHLEYQVV
jgi:hypothetical protein